VLALKDTPTLASIKQTTGLHPTRVNVVVAELVEQGFFMKDRLGGKQVYRKTEKEGKPELASFDIQRKVKLRELSHMLQFAREPQGCRMAFLRRALGDDTAPNCGHCDLCHPESAPVLSQEEIDRTDRWLLENPIPIAAARMVGLSEGISLLDSKQRSPLFVRFMKTRQETDAPDQELLEILKPHLKKGFIQAVVPLPSTTWKARNATAKAIADWLEVAAYDDLLFWKTPPEQRQGTLLNNDQRKLNVHKKMEAQSAPAGPILLLDDYTGSGATLKEAARALRTVGGKELILIPLALATVKWRLGNTGFI